MTRFLAWGGAFLLLACGGSVRLREESLITGGSSNGGGTASFGGVGGATETAYDRDPCVFETIDELCSLSQCPASAADLPAACSDALSITNASTACGGNVVSIGSGLGGISWFFDAKGSLTGAIASQDIREECPDGHSSFESVYGTICAQQGEETNACVPADGCSPAPLMCDASEYCPASSDDALTAYCGSTSTLSVTTTPTTCGGSLLLVQTSSGDVRYCFDSEGRLIGTMSRPAATGVETPSGSECIANGMPTYACADDPQ